MIRIFCLPKFYKFFFLVFKKEHLSMNICKNFKLISWKSGRVLPFWMPRKATFYPIYDDFGIFSDFQILSDLGPSKKVPRSYFAFLTNIWPKTCVTPPKPKIFNLTFLTSWPWMTLTWHNVTIGLGGYSEVSKTRSMSFYRLFFNLVLLLCQAKRAMTDIQKFDLLPNLSRHQWRSNYILQYVRKVQARSYQMPFSHRESTY